MAMRGRTAWDPLVDLLLARKVNAALGGAFFGPWNIGELDQPTIDLITAFIDELPAMQKGRAKLDAHLAAWRAKHPTYRKHGKVH